MRRHTVLIALATFAVLITAGVWAYRRGAGGPVSPRAAAADAALEAAIAEVEAGRRTTPLIDQPTPGGDATVTFLARRSGDQAPRIVSDLTGWGARADGAFDLAIGTMPRVGQTEWYSLRAQVSPRARIEYFIAYGSTDYQRDPFNPRQSVPRPGNLAASEFVMPGYQPPQEFVDPPVAPAGRTTEVTLESRILGGSRRVIVYTPPNYPSGRDYPLAVFHDGGLVAGWGEVPRVIDWLIAHHSVQPLVAVFVDPESRGGDYRRGAPMRAFVTGELLAWVASRYKVTSSPGKRAIVGISYSARGALDAVTSADAFGLLGLLVPGRGAVERADLEAIAERRHGPLRVAILAGQYDQPNIMAARRVREALAAAGHAVDYIEVPEGHAWRGHLRGVLESLFGGKPAPSTLPR